jgi:hypothetical protein
MNGIKPISLNNLSMDGGGLCLRYKVFVVCLKRNRLIDSSGLVNIIVGYMDSIPDVCFGTKAETQIWIDRSFFLNLNTLIRFAASNMFLS